MGAPGLVDQTAGSQGTWALRLLDRECFQPSEMDRSQLNDSGVDDDDEPKRSRPQAERRV